jgi:hypothetical protein
MAMPPVSRCVRRAVLACAASVVAVSVAGCTSTHHETAANGTSPSTFVATRWWSNAAVTAGSTISPAHPDAAAKELHPSKADYCGMLKQTLQAGKAILPSGKADDPKLVIGTEAFVAEIQKVAPAEVSGSWQVLGPTILAIVKGGGNLPSGSTSVNAKNLLAAQAINTDSKKNCGGLDLSSVVTG